MTEDGALTPEEDALIDELTERMWGDAYNHEPEIIANVLGALLAEFLSNWGRKLPLIARRQVQVDIMLSLARIAFDLLDVHDHCAADPPPRKRRNSVH